jgi:uncharacterized membrane protein SirB2
VYDALKWLHVGAVAVSGAGFTVRAALMLAGSALPRMRFARVAPHVIDTILLAAGVALAVRARLWPGDHLWLAAKIAALPVYIILGATALHHGRTRRIRLLALAGALASFAYIVGTALARDPAWPLAFV